MSTLGILRFPTHTNYLAPVAWNCLVLLLALVLAACAQEQDSGEHLDNARDRFAAEDYRSAFVHVKNALQDNPDAAEGRWLLGRIHLAVEDYPAAEKELRRAGELGWPGDEVRPALATALLAQELFGEVQAISVEGLGANAQAEVLAAQATAALSRGDRATARKLAAQARSAQPEASAVRLAEARILYAEDDNEGALATLDDQLARFPENIDALRLKGLILMRERELTRARAAFNEAIEQSDQELDARVYRALIDIEFTDLDRAAQGLQELQAIAPEHPSTQYVKGLLLYRQHDLAGAIKALSRARPIAARHPSIRYYLAIAQQLEGSDTDAYANAVEYHERQPDSIRGRKLLAALELARGNAYLVEGLLRPVLDFDPLDTQALSLLANALLKTGYAERSMNHYLRLARLQALAPPAEPSPEQRLYSPPIPDRNVARIVARLHAGEHDSAIRAARDYQLENAASIDAYNVLARVYTTAGKSKEARDVLQKVLVRDPHNPDANMLLGRAELAQGNLKKARQFFTSALADHPTHLPAILAMIGMEALDGSEIALRHRLEHAIQVRPDALEPRLGLALFELRRGQPEAVAPALAPLSSLQRRSPRVRGLLSAARLAAALPEEAEPQLRQLLETPPAAEHYFYLLARTALGTTQQDRVKRDLLRIQRANPNFPPVLMGLIIFAQAEQDGETLLRYLDQLVSLAVNPDAPAILRLRAIGADIRGAHEEAVQLARRAFDQAPQRGLMLELVAYERKAGLETSSLETLRAWLDEHPQDNEARMLLADLLLRAGDTQGAAASYAVIVEAEPDNAIALNNLAWALRHDQPARALEYILRAGKLLPGRADILDSVAVIEHLNGRHRRALLNIEAALAKKPGDPSMRFHRAQICAALGKTGEAAAELRELVHGDATAFPEYAEAQALLDSLGD